MSVNIIQANYDELETIAGRFGSQAEANAELHSRVQHCVQALQQGEWEGEGATAFFDEMDGQMFPAKAQILFPQNLFRPNAQTGFSRKQNPRFEHPEVPRV